jgi:hypothetical protein
MFGLIYDDTYAPWDNSRKARRSRGLRGPAAYTCPNCGRTVPDWYKSHVCLPPKKDFAVAARIDPGVALALELTGAEP